MSGNSNVICYLEAHGQPSSPEIGKPVMETAKRSSRILSEAEILEIVQKIIFRRI